MKKPITIKELCQREGIARITAMRWLCQGILKKTGSIPSPHGKPTLLVVRNDKRPKPKRFSNTWIQFRDACRAKDCDPKDVLLKLVIGANGDPDLLHAGIRLVFHEYAQNMKIPSRFLDFLYGKIPLERITFVDCDFKKITSDHLTFASFVADLLRNDNRTPPTNMTFLQLWQKCQIQILGWTPKTFPCLHGSRDARNRVEYRIVEFPRYSLEFSRKTKLSAPRWAYESVAKRKLHKKHRPDQAQLAKAIMRQDKDKPSKALNQAVRLIEKSIKTYAENGDEYQEGIRDGENAWEAQQKTVYTTTERIFSSDEVGKAMKILTGKDDGICMSKSAARHLIRSWVHLERTSPTMTTAAAKRMFCCGEPKPNVPR
jgi:hypothetical protein